MRKFLYSLLITSQLFFSTVIAEQKYRTLFIEKDKDTVVEATDTDEDGYLDDFTITNKNYRTSEHYGLTHDLHTSSVRMPNSYVKKLVKKYEQKDRSVELRNAKKVYSQTTVDGYFKVQGFPEAGFYFKFSPGARLQDYKVLDYIGHISKNGGFTDADLIIVKTQLEFEKYKKINNKR